MLNKVINHLFLTGLGRPNGVGGEEGGGKNKSIKARGLTLTNKVLAGINKVNKEKLLHTVTSAAGLNITRQAPVDV